jgi:hypothetical protein
MKSRTWTLGSVLTLLVVVLVATATVYAAPIRVDCGRGGSISATLASLASAGNTRGVTIFVTGTCKENIVIGGFDHLVLQGLPIATLQDASNGTAEVVLVFSSFDVLLQSFTIKRGANGLDCVQYSFCDFSQGTVQQAAGVGVRFARSNGIVQSSNIVNNALHGIQAVNGSTLLTISNQIKDNSTAGILVLSGSNLTAQLDTIQGNVPGIRASGGSVVRASGLTITGNTSDGVRLESESSAAFAGDNAITGNGGNGVAIHDLSFASFNGDNISGNLTQPDVACYPQYSATRGAGTVGGTTNCVEPRHKE